MSLTNQSRRIALMDKVCQIYDKTTEYNINCNQQLHD